MLDALADATWLPESLAAFGDLARARPPLAFAAVFAFGVLVTWRGALAVGAVLAVVVLASAGALTRDATYGHVTGDLRAWTPLALAMLAGGMTGPVSHTLAGLAAPVLALAAAFGTGTPHPLHAAALAAAAGAFCHSVRQLEAAPSLAVGGSMATAAVFAYGMQLTAGAAAVWAAGFLVAAVALTALLQGGFGAASAALAAAAVIAACEPLDPAEAPALLTAAAAGPLLAALPLHRLRWSALPRPRQPVLADVPRARTGAPAASAADRRADWLAAMSHDLRTPLNAVVGNLELLAQAPRPDQAGLIEDALHASRALLGIIGDVLDMARIEAERIDPDVAPVDVAELLTEIDAAVAPAARGKGLYWALLAMPGMPAVIETDRRLLTRIVFNLCGNAVKFTPEGAVTLRVAWTAGHLALTVADTGTGIDAAALDRLTQPYIQGAAGVQHGGTGLGLAIVRRFVTALGGRLGARAKPGRGVAFDIDIPAPGTGDLYEGRALPRCGGDRVLLDALGAAPAADPEVLVFHHAPPVLPSPGDPARVVAEGDPETAPPGVLVGLSRTSVMAAGAVWRRRAAPRVARTLSAPLPLLVVDDVALNRNLVLRQLRDLGLRADTAENGRVALERMEARRYALVLVDWAMPEMDGLAFTSAWRRRESAGRMPIVGLSARALAGDRERALAAGMDEYLHKPVPIDALADVLARWLPAAPGHTAAAVAATAGVVGDAAEPVPSRFDRRALERFVGSDDPNRVREVLADCFASFPDMLDDILKAADRDALGKAAHAAKGVAACVGALELKDTLAALEREAATCELAALLGLARRARREFDGLVEQCTVLGLAGPVPGMESGMEDVA